MPKARRDNTLIVKKTDEFSTKYLNKLTNGTSKSHNHLKPCFFAANSFTVKKY